MPDANAIWTDDATHRFDRAHLAVAVSVPNGLLTPVARGADQLSLGALSATVRELAGRAREGRIKQRELEGGTFAVSNLGMFGTVTLSADHRVLDGALAAQWLAAFVKRIENPLPILV